MDGQTDLSVTAMLGGWFAGHDELVEPLSRAVVPDLQRIARARCQRERLHDRPQPDELVSETWITMARSRARLRFDNRRRFFAWASRVMSSCVQERGRRRGARKRGGRRCPGAIPLSCAAPAERADRCVELRDLLQALRSLDARAEEILRQRYLDRVPCEQVARALSLPAQEVARVAARAREWIRRELRFPPERSD